MTEKQEQILEGTISMHKKLGEMVPAKLFDKDDLDVLVELDNIKIINNPYGIGDAFFGVVGKEYPIGFNELVDFRSMRDSFGDASMARKLVRCIKL